MTTNEFLHELFNHECLFSRISAANEHWQRLEMSLLDAQDLLAAINARNALPSTKTRINMSFHSALELRSVDMEARGLAVEVRSGADRITKADGLQHVPRVELYYELDAARDELDTDGILELVDFFKPHMNDVSDAGELLESLSDTYALGGKVPRFE